MYVTQFSFILSRIQYNADVTLKLILIFTPKVPKLQR
jgi:hypothetical protein